MSTDIIVIGDKQLTVQDIANALYEVNGNLAKAAEILGVRRGKLFTAINRHSDLRELHEDFLEAAIDNAQANVFEAVEAKNYAASCFLLSTLGKERGYSTKQELTVKKAEVEELSDEELRARTDALRQKYSAPRPVETFNMKELTFAEPLGDSGTPTGAETHEKINREASGEGYISGRKV